MQLQVGDGFVGVALDEASGFGEVGGQRPAAPAAPLEQTAQHGQHPLRRDAEQVGQLRRVDHHHHVRVIVQVLPHARQVEHRCDAVCAQVVRRPDAREHQQLRRAEGAGTEQHLATGLERQGLQRTAPAVGPHLHPHRTGTAVKRFGQHPGGERVGKHLQVRPAAVRCEVGLGRAEALAVLVRDLVDAHALLFGAVEIVVERVTGLPAGLDEVGQHRVGRAQVHHVERAARAVPVVGAAFVVLGALEVGQHLGKRPARVALGGPGVVVLRVTAGVDHGVDGAGPAQHLATRLVAPPAVQTRLRHGAVTPAIELVLGHHGQAGRAVDEHAAVGRSRFNQGHPQGRVFAQATGQHAAGRPAAHDDVIEHVLSWRRAPEMPLHGAARQCGSS